MAFRRHHDVQQAMSKEGGYRAGQAVVAQRKRGRLINARLEVQILPTAPADESRLRVGRDSLKVAVLVQIQALVPAPL